MASTYKLYSRFISGGNGGAKVEELWSNGTSFSVRRTSGSVHYPRGSGSRLDDSGAFTSITESPTTGTRAWSTMANAARQLPAMPEIGRPESYYAKMAQQAEQQGNVHLHEASKVGQYITLAMDPNLSWEEKLKYFRHALKRHCSPPPYPDDDVWMFYQRLAELVKQHSGHEALRLASIEDDLYAARLNMGQMREKIEDDAEQFFQHLLGGHDRCPEWCTDSDWSQLKLLRDQWI